MFHVKHLLNKESFVRGIVFSSIINTVSKLILFLTSLVLANIFGAGNNTDIYFYLYSTLWLFITVFSSLNVAVIIPEAMQRRSREGERQAMHFFTFFLYVFMVVSLVVMALLFLDPVLVVSWISKFDIPVLQEYRMMIFWFAPLFPIILVTQYLIDLLNAYRYFILPVVTGLINNVLALVFICLFFQILDLYSMILALYFGYFLHFGYLIYVMRRDFAWDFTPKIVYLKRHFKENFWVGLFGNFWNFIGKYATNYFLSASGIGLLTAYNYGQKLTNVPTEAITNQFSSVSAIRLNELMAQGSGQKSGSVFIRLCNVLIFILTPIATIFYFYAEDIVSLFYLRGEFGLEDVMNTAFFMRYLGFLLPLYGVHTIVSRLYNAGQIIKFSTIYSVISNILIIGFLWVAFSLWGIWGIPFALLVQFLLNVVVAHFFIKHFFPWIGYGRVLVNLALMIAGCLALASGIVYLFDLSPWSGMVKMIAGSVAFGLTYLGMNELFSINRDVSNYIKKWLGIVVKHVRN